MTVETVLQHWVLTGFVYPFLLAFFVIFAILEKTKVLGGDDKKQLNALVAFVIGLIFVAAIEPKIVVNNMILFLTVSIIVVFVFMVLWTFVIGKEMEFSDNKSVKIGAAVLMFIAVAVAVLWATGTIGDVYRYVFGQTWSKEFWTNAIFILVIAGALAAVTKKVKGKE